MYSSAEFNECSYNMNCHASPVWAVAVIPYTQGTYYHGVITLYLQIVYNSDTLSDYDHSSKLIDTIDVWVNESDGGD